MPRWLHREYDGFEHRQDSGRTKTHPFYNGPLGGPYAHVNNYRQPQRDPWVYHDESQKDRGWGHTVAYSDDARRFDESIGYEPKFEGCECCGGLGLRGGYRSNGSGNSDLPSKPTFNIHHPKGNNVDLNNQQTVPHSEHSGVPIHPSQVAKPSPTDFAVLYDPRTGLPLNPQPETGHTFQDYDGDAEYVPEYQPTPPTPPPFRGLRYSPGPFPLDRQWDHCHQGSTSYGQQHGPRGPLHPRPNPPGPRPSLNNSIASTCSESPSDPSLDSSPHGPTDSQTQHSFLWGMMGAWGTFFMQLVYGQDPTQTHIDIQEARLREGSGEGDSYSEAVFQELDRRGALAANEARLGMRNRGPES